MKAILARTAERIRSALVAGHHLARAAQTVGDRARVVADGGELPLVTLDRSALVTWRDPGGLDLHPGGHGGRRRMPPRLVVVHWGGLDPASCRRTLAARGYSSHFGVGKGRVYQWLDLVLTAWHAGAVNAAAVGIDVCQSPEVKHLARHRAQGLAVDVVDNPTDRGADRVLSLDPEIALATRGLVLGLCEALGIPPRCPRGRDGTASEGPVFHGVLSEEAIASFSGVVGHHHLKGSKWDVAPWWPALFEGTALE